MSTCISFCSVLTNDTKKTTKRGKKKKNQKFNKFIKKTNEVIANKTCKQNFGRRKASR